MCIILLTPVTVLQRPSSSFYRGENNCKEVKLFVQSHSCLVVMIPSSAIWPWHSSLKSSGLSRWGWFPDPQNKIWEVGFFLGATEFTNCILVFLLSQNTKCLFSLSCLSVLVGRTEISDSSASFQVLVSVVSHLAAFYQGTHRNPTLAKKTSNTASIKYHELLNSFTYLHRSPSAVTWNSHIHSNGFC